MAFVDIKDTTQNSFNPGDIAARSLGGSINFGVTDKTFRTIGIAAAVVIGVVAIAMLQRGKKRKR